MPSLLDPIVARTREDLPHRKSRASLADLEGQFSDISGRSFYQSLSDGRRRGRPRLIAELKKASPSKGLLNPNFDAVTLARQYAQGGAAALSVLTEPHFFLGAPEYLQQAFKTVRIPL